MTHEKRQMCEITCEMPLKGMRTLWLQYIERASEVLLSN